MQVELGNDFPNLVEHDGHPRVSYVSIPDTYTYVPAYDDGTTQLMGNKEVDITTADDLAVQAAAQIGRSVDGITRMPDQEALLAVIGAWRSESSGNPTWVWSDNDDFAVLLGAFFACPVGRPDDVEATHHTDAGAPGVGPVDAEAAASVSLADEPGPSTSEEVE